MPMMRLRKEISFGLVSCNHWVAALMPTDPSTTKVGPSQRRPSEADTVFSGVHHGNDNTTNSGLRQFPNAEHWKPCKSEWNVDARRIRNSSNSSWHSESYGFAEPSGCKSKGITVKYDEEATRQTKQAIEGKLTALGFVTQ